MVKVAELLNALLVKGADPVRGTVPDSVEVRPMDLENTQPHDEVVVDDLIDKALRGLEPPKGYSNSVIKLFRDACRSQPLTSDEVRIAASSYAQTLCEGYDVDVEDFVQKLAFAEKITPFVVEVLKELLENPGEKFRGAVVAGTLFHAMGDVEKQRAVLEQIDNIGVGARLIHWAAYEAKGSSGKDSYQENNLRFSELSLSGNKKLKLMCMTAASTGIEIETKHDPWNAAKVQDRILRLFEDYYNNSNHDNYNLLRRKLECRKENGLFAQYFVSQPNEDGEIEELGIYYNVPESKSEQEVASSDPDEWQPYGEYIERIRQAKDAMDRDPSEYVLFHRIACDLEDAGDLDGTAEVWEMLYEYEKDSLNGTWYLWRKASVLGESQSSDRSVETYERMYNDLIRQGVNRDSPWYTRIFDDLRHFYNDHGMESAADFLKEMGEPLFPEE